ncbi:DUF4421 domain-containing protein [Chitinophaga barathri]|uniref:DUF4421 domain-containing protein n=1 Tax=Chitinophaga barathri TaxID=1647451 RepID=A0A3N4MFF5_9BACT|nr:DUF4421 domain-containing protein [Chitinophaga barathri]RPD42328.1 DUF4421 domain-containing protein [Chitinophaga barathri]
MKVPVIASILMLSLCAGAVKAQEGPVLKWLFTENDSNYVEDHTNDLTVRLLGSRKYTYWDMRDKNIDEEVQYRPNANNNVGFGANYKWLGVNFAFNLPFINDDDDKYGKTKFLDLQAHLYLRKLVVDFYGQYYEGFYQAETARRISNGIAQKAVSFRPDIINRDLGLNVQYVFNDRKFSYRAAFMQNEYQKKSAGSFLAGGEIFVWEMRGDSALVPAEARTDGFFGGSTFNRTSQLSLAVNAGYAYTLVIAKYFFVTASVIGSIGANRTVNRFNDGTPHESGYGLQLNNTIRFAAGYNSSYYYFGLHYTDMGTRGSAPGTKHIQTFGTGNIRFSLVKRFKLKKTILPAIFD